MSVTSATLPAREPVSNADRLALALCLAIVVHALLILGVGFAPELPPVPASDRIEVLLVPDASREAPADADSLAQVNARASGLEQGPGRPTTPVRTAAPQPALQANVTPSAPARPAPPTPETEAAAEQGAPPGGRAARSEAAETETALTAVPDPQAPPLARSAPPAATEPRPQPQRAATAPRPDAPSAEELIARSLAVASLSARIDERLQARAAEPRRKYISASTREYKYAAYLEAWRAKVERIGNLNYPEEARRRGLSGSLILEVVLRPDGSLAKVRIRRSSGHKVLDDAAVHIVRLAAPFAPFPPAIRKEVDELHITRTWQFLNTSRMTSR